MNKNKNEAYLLIFVLTVAVVAVVAVLYAFIDKFGFGYWEKIEEWAQTGDFFGGILNPIFAFLSLILIAYTLMQNIKALRQSKIALELGNEELKLSRIDFSKTVEALEYQKFENRFFNMLSIHNEILNDIVFDTESIMPLHNPENYTGKKRTAFKAILLWINGELEDLDPLSLYEDLQEQANQVVGHYFRNLYEIIRTVDESNINDDDKDKFICILSSQLSSDEISVLLFYCLSKENENKKLKELIVKYEMLKDLKCEPFLNVGFFRVSTESIIVKKEEFKKLLIKDEKGNIKKSAFGRKKFIDNLDD